MKGQKVALALWNLNCKFGVEEAFKRWSINTIKISNEERSIWVRKNVEEISIFKESIRKYELENEDLANENEELRQFSLDGYEIAKNV